MSERHEKITRYCDFCSANLTKEYPVPGELTFSRSVGFKPEGKDTKTVEYSIAIKLNHYEGRNQVGGKASADMCPDCVKAITLSAASHIFGWKLVEKVMDDKIAEAENRMKDEVRQIARLHMEANFGPMLDAHMAHRRSRKKGGC